MKRPPPEAVDVDALEIPAELLKLVSYETLRRRRALPFRLVAGRLAVAAADHEDVSLQEDLRLWTGLEVELWRAEPAAIARTLARHAARLARPQAEPPGPAAEPSAVDAAARLLAAAAARRASDLHLEPQANALFVRLRVDGVLETAERLPKEAAAALVSRLKVLAGLDVTERRLPQDGHIREVVDGREMDLRLSTLPGKYGEKVVIRLLDKTAVPLDLGRLGLAAAAQGRLERLIERPQGMLLVTGPTGSGKTTTLYSLLNRLKSPLRNIITLEDPVEFELLSGVHDESGITQVQVNPKVGLTFAAALRAALRQDPDVLMVGEIRDRETAEVALRAALTGHLVFSTLHTNGAPETLERLRDIGADPYLIASTVTGVLAQRLVRVLCASCKRAYRPPEKLLRALGGDGGELYRPTGCPRCGGTGYRGRMGIYELLELDAELKAAFAQGAGAAALRETLSRQGAPSLPQAGMALVLRGLTTVEEVQHVALA